MREELDRTASRPTNHYTCYHQYYQPDQNGKFGKEQRSVWGSFDMRTDSYLLSPDPTTDRYREISCHIGAL